MYNKIKKEGGHVIVTPELVSLEELLEILKEEEITSSDINNEKEKVRSRREGTLEEKVQDITELEGIYNILLKVEAGIIR